MAKIYPDRIEVGNKDPKITIRCPPSLKYWTEQAALFRGTSVEDMLLELLYDHFGRTPNAKGEYETHHENEQIRRKRMVQARWDKLRNERVSAKLIELDERRLPDGTLRPKARVTKLVKDPSKERWALYKVAREENLRRLVEKELTYDDAIMTKQHRTRKEMKKLYPHLKTAVIDGERVALPKSLLTDDE